MKGNRIITRLRVLLIGTSVMAIATWIKPSWMRFRVIIYDYIGH